MDFFNKTVIQKDMEKTVLSIKTRKYCTPILLINSIILISIFTTCIKSTLATSSNDNKPALTMIPLPEVVHEIPLIWYNVNNLTQIKYWNNILNKSLEPYLNLNITSEHMNCNHEHPVQPGKVCTIDIKDWTPCTSANMYSYQKSSPCIFLKLNQISNWTPEYYDDPNDLPNDMPIDLRERIKILPRKHMKQIWIYCSGANPVDGENLNAFTYVPVFGFENHYFPYTGTEGYLNPIVAVQIENPKKYIIISIECVAWAKNIARVKGQGLIQFELLID